METYRRINKIIRKLLGTYFLLFLSMWALFLFTRCSNEEFDNGNITPYHQYYSLDNTEYRIKDLSIDEFVSRFTALIQSDTAACYGKRKVLIIDERNNTKHEEYRIDTMKVDWGRLGWHNAEGKGPRYCNISIFLPLVDSDSIHKKYSGKFLFTFIVIDTQPTTLIIPRSLYSPNSLSGMVFGEYQIDLSEQIKVNKLSRYFRKHYLDYVCNYDNLAIKNTYYMFMRLIISTTSYLPILIGFIFIWLGIRILYRWTHL